MASPRLTNYVRNAFVAAVMNDVPSVDYDEQARKLIDARLDELFQKAFPGMSRSKAADTGWLNVNNLYTPSGLRGIRTAAPDDCYFIKKQPDLWAELEKLGAAANKQAKARDELRDKLRSIAYSYTTRKALAAALPELEKYLPTEESTSRSLPVVTNVVADFVKAGWPKGAKQPEPA